MNLQKPEEKLFFKEDKKWISKTVAFRLLFFYCNFKELVLLFKDSNNIFSYAGLLIVQPFLLYLVVSALNGVFSSGTFAYYLIALPYFLPVLDIVLIMLFTVIINSGANNYISKQKILKLITENQTYY